MRFADHTVWHLASGAGAALGGGSGAAGSLSETLSRDAVPSEAQEPGRHQLFNGATPRAGEKSPHGLLEMGSMFEAARPGETGALAIQQAAIYLQPFGADNLAMQASI